jgi:cell division transport system ATP-binding protein
MNLDQSLQANSGNSLNNHHPGSNCFFLKDVSVKYGEIQALKSIQLTIDHGEVIFITGASGAGKTTLLNVMAGNIIPTSGKVFVPPLTSSKKHFLISQVFQDLRLIGRLSLEKNLLVSFDRNIYHSKNEYMEDLMELARVFGIKDRLHLKAKDANGGLKQKVAIMRALLAKPDVFLADEPTSSLDFNNASKLFEVFNYYNVKKGMTVVWASHNRELVKKFTGRIVHLDAGKLVYSGHACFI